MRIIAVTSGKGGAGKTFFSVNLAYALAKLNKSVTLIDANFTTPNTALLSGYLTYFNTIHDFLSEKVNDVSKIIFRTAYGFKIVAGSVDLESMINARIENFKIFLEKLKDEFIILDTAAGIGREALTSLMNSNEIILVVNPEISSIIDAKRVLEVCKRIDKRVISVVANRVNNKNDVKKIEEYLNREINLILPEDKRVRISIEKRVPFIELYPNSFISSQILTFASYLSGELIEFKPSIWEMFKFRSFL
ncbi:MAG: P-loop NTPase [Candidatus Aenigmatarchaeota archaeon]